MLLQVLDDGRLTDGQGRTVDFKNTVIIMTSNIGSQWITDVAAGDYTVMKERVMEAVQGQFKPEFINRVDEMIIFRALTQEDLKRIVDLQLAYLGKRTQEQGIVLEFTERLKEAFAKEGYDPVYGARPEKAHPEEGAGRACPLYPEGRGARRGQAHRGRERAGQGGLRQKRREKARSGVVTKAQIAGKSPSLFMKGRLHAADAAGGGDASPNNCR